MKFKELKLNKNILKALAEAGYEQPTPIQEQSIPSVLEGRDLLGCAGHLLACGPACGVD